MSWREQVTIRCLGAMPIHDRLGILVGAIRLGPGDGASGLDKANALMGSRCSRMTTLITRAIDRLLRSR